MLNRAMKTIHRLSRTGWETRPAIIIRVSGVRVSPPASEKYLETAASCVRDLDSECRPAQGCEQAPWAGVSPSAGFILADAVARSYP